MKLKSQTILQERVRSFLQDGFLIVVRSSSPTFAFYKLRHRLNGNVITISAEPFRNWMVQRTNDKITYTGPIQP
jgi:hypothetical protein